MGQAKQRGTFTERQAAAIVRDNAIVAEKKRLQLEEEVSKTPEERKKELKNKLFLIQMIGMMLPYIPSNRGLL
jgi:hypothetical protein